VAGVGPSLRVREGIREADRCLTIYVEEKLSPEELRDRGYTMLEPYLQGANGARVPTDVVELGTLHRQALAGDSVSEVGKSRRGTLGAFATDLLEGGTVGITAMHVLNPVAGASIDCVCPGHGMSGSEPLGSFRRGRMARIDAALMSTERAGATRNFLPGLGEIRGWRSVTLSGDRNLPVLMWGAESGTLMNGVLREPLIHLPSENLQSAILAEIESIDGDSGAALLDEDNWILGFLVGTVGPPPAVSTSRSPLRRLP
jgi:hypothetical protein